MGLRNHHDNEQTNLGSKCLCNHPDNEQTNLALFEILRCSRLKDYCLQVGECFGFCGGVSWWYHLGILGIS
jgi:hypothetical protein